MTVTDFASHIQDYPRTRRALGFKLPSPGRTSHSSPLILTLPARRRSLSGWPSPEPVSLRMCGRSQDHRLGAVCGFARHLHWATLAPFDLSPARRLLAEIRTAEARPG